MLCTSLRSLRRTALLGRDLGRGFSACACALPQSLPVTEAAPATVSEYHQHILVKLPQSEGHQDTERLHGSWWEQFVEKDPRIFQAFKTIATNKNDISSTIKITAFDDVGSRLPLDAESCELMAFPDGVRYTKLPLKHLGEVVLHTVADDPAVLPPISKQVSQLQEPIKEVVLLVCCHGARDARCGALGPPLATKLLQLVRHRGLQEHIRVYKTSHVGGHKYAGNVVVYGAMHPCDGDWFGGVHADDAEEFLDGIVNIEIGADGGAEDAVLRQWWRGRMGLSKGEQGELFEQGGGIEAFELMTDEDGDDEEEEEGVEGWEEEFEERMKYRGPPGRRPTTLG